jgi:hypothetical protein
LKQQQQEEEGAVREANPQKQVLEHVKEEVEEHLLTALKKERLKKKYSLLLALFGETWE